MAQETARPVQVAKKLYVPRKLSKRSKHAYTDLETACVVKKCGGDRLHRLRAALELLLRRGDPFGLPQPGHLRVKLVNKH